MNDFTKKLDLFIDVLFWNYLSREFDSFIKLQCVHEARFRLDQAITCPAEKSQLFAEWRKLVES